MTVQNLAGQRLAIMAQSGLGALASGAGAFGVECLPSTGLARAVASIESNMIRRNRMRLRPRHGSVSASASYETELQVGALDGVYEGVLGCDAVAAQSFSNTDWGAVTITGTGTIATFAGGTLLDDGIVAGMVFKFTSLSVGANNDVYAPVLQVVSNTVAHFAPGYLIDNGSDNAYTVTVAKHFKTETPYRDALYTFEEQQPSINRSKLGEDMRFNSLNCDSAANQYAKIGFGAGGRNMSPVASVDYPNFTDPLAYNAVGDSLILLDGGIYINGVKRSNVPGITWGLAAPVNTTAVVGSRIAPDISLGQFAFTGDVKIVVEDFDDLDAFTDEDDISLFLHYAEKLGTLPQRFVSFYFGHLSYGGFSTPFSGEGDAIASIPLYGGSDTRGAGYFDTTALISVSNV